MMMNDFSTTVYENLQDTNNAASISYSMIFQRHNLWKFPQKTRVREETVNLHCTAMFAYDLVCLSMVLGVVIVG